MCIFIVKNAYARILFDSGATHSFIARDFMIEVGLVTKRFWFRWRSLYLLGDRSFSTLVVVGFVD